jgi:hypothetical protein
MLRAKSRLITSNILGSKELNSLKEEYLRRAGSWNQQSLYSGHVTEGVARGFNIGVALHITPLLLLPLLASDFPMHPAPLRPLVAMHASR